MRHHARISAGGFRPDARCVGVLKQRVDAADLMTNELIGEINRFDAEAIARTAREYTSR